MTSRIGQHKNKDTNADPRPVIADHKPAVADDKAAVVEAAVIAMAKTEAEKPAVPEVAQVAPAAPATEKHPVAQAPAKAKAHIRSTPEGAQVARAADGEALGTTPFDLELPASDQPVALLFWKKGFAVKERKIVPRGELSVAVDLSAEPAPMVAKIKKKSSKRMSTTTTIDPFN